MTHRLLCSFHPSGQSCAIVSHDQRLKIFSTLTHQLQHDLTEAQHLTHTITCLAYPIASSSKSSVARDLVAVGTKGGDVLLWNTKKAAIEHKLGATTSQSEKHQAAVTSVVFHASGAFLFTASADRTVKQWNVANGTFVASFAASEDTAAAAFSKLACSPDGNLLAAGGAGALILWNIATPSTPLREYQGPTERIACVAFSPDSKYLVSGNAADRHLTIWSTEEEEAAPAATEKQKKKSKKSAAPAARNTPLHTLTLQTPPISVQFNAYAKSGAYQIGALSDSSILSLLQFTPAASTSAASGTPATATTPSSTITIPASTSQSEAAKRRDAAYNAAGKNNKHKATAASSTLLTGEQGDAVGVGAIQAFAFESPTKLMVARGDAVRPQFESVEYRKSAEGEFEASITLGKFQSQHLMNNASNASTVEKTSNKRKASASAINNEAVTLGAQHTTDQVQSASSALDGESAKKKTKVASNKSKSDVLSRSLADRLAESEALAVGGASFNLATGELPKAGSLQTILQQALHSNDTSLIEYCLTAGAQQQASNATLIRSTVKRLAPVYVLPLLNHLMTRFASRPNRSAALLPWLREIFKAHTAYLIAQPELTTKLAPLYHLLDTRLSVFKKLLKLQGRLELLLSQISASKNVGAEEESELAAPQGPLNTFNDGEEEDAEGERDDDEEDEDEDEMEEGEEDDLDEDEDMEEAEDDEEDEE